MEGFPTVPRGLWGPLSFGRSQCDKQNKLPSLIDRCLGVFFDGQINHTSITRPTKLAIPMCMIMCKPCGNLAMEVSTYMDANSFRNTHIGCNRSYILDTSSAICQKEFMHLIKGQNPQPYWKL